MKSQKVFLISAILFASFQIGFAQENHKAVLIDEFGLIGCEELLARLDNFMSDLMNEPNSIGYAVIYGKQGNLIDNAKYEGWINGQIRFRNFDAGHLIAVRGKERDNLKIELWRIPKGIEKPFSAESKWNVDLSKIKPFVFYSYGYNSEICSGNPLATERAGKITAPC